MTYEEKIPEFALQPARAASETAEDPLENDGFDPTPYDRLLVPEEYGEESLKQDDKQTKEENKVQQSAVFPAGREADPEEDSVLNQTQAADPDKAQAAAPDPIQQQGAVPVLSPEPNSEMSSELGADPDPRQNLTPEPELEEKAEQSLSPRQAPKQDQSPIQRAESGSGQKAEPEPIHPVVFRAEEAPQEGSLQAAPESIKMIPMENSAVYKELKMNIISQKLEMELFVEEDILVPDIKPDLKQILCMDGKAIVSSKEIQIGQGSEDGIRVTGEVLLQTIYLPESKEENEAISIIQSRLPFKTDWQVSASPMSHLSICANVEKIDYTIINERKFRAKVTACLMLSEYAEKELQMFDSIRNENLELLKETVKISHVALRKEDSIEISEDLKLKEGSLKPVRILKSDIRVVENHKQITSEKMVINANIMVNILYMGEETNDEDTYSKPAFFQGKTDFTQFILMDQYEDAAMCKVDFNEEELEVKINEESDCFSLRGSVNTSVEVLTNMEKEMVTDLYHSSKDTTYDFSENQIETVIGTGMTETSAREILNVPEHMQADRVIYAGGRIKEKKETVEPGRVMVEGVILGEVICLSDDEQQKAFAIKQDIPFRGAMEIPSAQAGMKAESKVEIKDLWFDKINGKQVEVNVSLQATAAAIKVSSLKLIKNPCFVENSHSGRPSSMVIYITKKNDSLWKIAKRYKISMDAIREVNQMEEGSPIKQGMRLLVVK